MRERDADPLRDHYINRIKRLTAIPNKDEHTTTVDEKLSTGGPDKHMCLVCGNMWDVDFEKKEGPKKCPACSSVLWNSSGLTRHRCKQCSHMWMSKADSPFACPGCKSRFWDEEVEKFRCMSCRSEWDHRVDRGPPEKCPKCLSDDVKRDLVECMCECCGYNGKMKSELVNRCPICWTALSAYSTSPSYKERITGYQRSDWKKIYAASGPLISTILGSNIDDIKKIRELGSRIGLDITDAEILVKFNNGEDPVSIARTTDTSLNRVMMATNPLRDWKGERCK